jgi:sorbitol-specific phosphotransferase system component IIBC
MATLKKVKDGAKGGGRYVDEMTGAKVIFNRKAFVDGVAPDTIEIACETWAPPDPKAVKRAETAEQKQARIAARYEKAKARAEKLQSQLAKVQEKVSKTVESM